jgi:hypothetical protein
VGNHRQRRTPRTESSVKQVVITMPAADGRPPLELLVTTWIADPSEVDIRVADGLLWRPIAHVGGTVRDA